MRREWTGPTSYRTASWDPVERPGRVLPFGAMSATSEAPAAFRHSAARPGPLALIREGIDEILSRRRLVRYLVQADLRKKGADTLLGNVWWVLDPLLQMVVYVVFVAIILQASTPDYPLFILSAQILFKLTERRIDGDAGGEYVHLGFNFNGPESSIAMVVDVIDRCGEHFVFQIVEYFRRRFRVRAPFDFEYEMMWRDSSFVAFVSDALIDQTLHSFDEF